MAKTAKAKFVTVDQFRLVEGAVGRILDLLEKKGDDAKDAKVDDKKETPEEKTVTAAAPNRFTVNPEWEETAQEILGEYLDHTEVEHEKTGGIKFTVVIKSEKSNAGQEYLSLTKTDRRTKEVGALGMDGVIEWCRLVRANLKRTEAK